MNSGEKEIEYAYTLASLVDECIPEGLIDNTIKFAERFDDVLEQAEHLQWKDRQKNDSSRQTYYMYVYWLVDELYPFSEVQVAWLIKNDHGLVDGLGETDRRYLLHEALQAEITRDNKAVAEAKARQAFYKVSASDTFFGSMNKHIQNLGTIQSRLRAHATPSDPRMRV